MFSITSRSSSSSGSDGRADRTMFASRWHSPPKPEPVSICVTGTCADASRSASSVPCTSPSRTPTRRSEEHTSELQSHVTLVCRLLLEKKNNLEIALFSDHLRAQERLLP